MQKYKFYYLIWLLPAYLLFLALHQTAVYYGLIDTFENGTTYNAEVIDFEIKQIAAQTNGYVVLRFETAGGDLIEDRLSLPLEMAVLIRDLQLIPIRYQPGVFQDIVMIPAYEAHKRMVLSNMGMLGLGLVITLIIALIVHRHIRRKREAPSTRYVIEHVD